MDDDQHIEDLDATEEEAGDVKGGYSWGVSNPGAVGAIKGGIKLGQAQQKFGDGSVMPGGFKGV
jgi:hypothetical protein